MSAVASPLCVLVDPWTLHLPQLGLLAWDPERANSHLPHRIPELLSIDHIAVPESAKIHSTTRVIAQDAAGNRLSDHDAYSTEVRLA